MDRGGMEAGSEEDENAALFVRLRFVTCTVQARP